MVGDAPECTTQKRILTQLHQKLGYSRFANGTDHPSNSMKAPLPACIAER